jgi:hypothetical protein
MIDPFGVQRQKKTFLTQKTLQLSQCHQLKRGQGGDSPKRGSKGRSPLGGGGGAAASHNPPPFVRGQGVGQSLHNFPKVDDIAHPVGSHPNPLCGAITPRLIDCCNIALSQSESERVAVW